ncbi:MAG: HAD family hydrolase [Chloroflexota bacterium]|nr:MAG: hydrolase [Chloroflexota bacterium]
MGQIEAVLLDMDGTLVDSNPAHAAAWVEALREHGYDVPFEDVLPLIGMGGDQLLPRVTNGVQKHSPEGMKIADRKKQIFKEKYWPRLRPFPCVRELVEHMQTRGMTVLVASSSTRRDVLKMMELAGIADLVQATSAEDAKRSKPAPDIIIAALQKTGTPAERTLMIGDTPYDIEAAGAVGVGVIGLRCGGWDDDALRGALAIYDDPADLLANFDRSPLALNGRG